MEEGACASALSSGGLVLQRVVSSSSSLIYAFDILENVSLKRLFVWNIIMNKYKNKY